MTAEAYVNKIVKKIKCSGKRRREIKRQLLSDISSELAGGEKLETIVGRMGEPREAAAEFNQNMPEAERRAYSRNKIIKVLAVIAVVIAAAICIFYWMLPKGAQVGESGVFTQSIVEEQVKQVVRELNDNDFESLTENASDAMKEALNQETIDDARSRISSDWGEFQSYGTVYMSEVEQKGRMFAVAQVSVAYENVSVTYTITFDEDMKVAGLFMK